MEANSGSREQKHCFCRVLEGKRMASGHTGNVVPRKGLRVRLPCPPLVHVRKDPMLMAVAVADAARSPHGAD